jgi:hypothetical protein
MAGFGQQLLVLIGVVVGALGTYLAGAATERTRWRREQSSRWDEKRAQAYADYGSAVKNVYVQCRRIADNYRGEDARSESPDYVEAISELGRLADERTAKWESVLLLGNPETIAAARTWHCRVWDVELYARGERTNAAGWNALLGEVAVARAHFYDEARRDLRIKSGDVPPSGPWEEPLVSLANGSPEVPTDVA